MCCVVVFSCEGMFTFRNAMETGCMVGIVPKKLIKTGCPNGQTAKFSSGNGEGVPPVLIPNTEVKPFRADGTWLETTRESRSPLDSKRKDCKRLQSFFTLYILEEKYHRCIDKQNFIIYN